MRYFLSIDYGGTSIKAILFDDKGKEIAVSSFPTLKIEDTPGFREIDLEVTWQAIGASIKEVIDTSAIASSAIAAVIPIGHGKGLYLLDKQQAIFCHGILSTDERANDLATAFEEKVDDLWGLTQQHVVGVQAPVLLRWLKEYDRASYDQIGWVLSAKDFIRFQLTGKVHQEYGDASGNHWINFQTGTYDPAILSFFGIEEMAQALPELVDCADIIGGVSKEAAKLTGLIEGTPVLGGLFDIDACAIGSGVLNDQTFSLISGTWNINTYPSKKAASQASGHMNSYFPNRDYLIEASSPTSAGNLDAILKMLMSEEIRTIKEQGHESIYDTLETFLEQTDASYTDLLFFPFLYGNNTVAEAKACFLGLSTKSTKSHMLRAVYEGIAFAHKQHITQLINAKGSAPKVIRMTGGATHSKAWVQLFADVLNLPIETVSGSELGGLGGALLAKASLDSLSLAEAVADMVRVKDTYYPNSAQNRYYQQKYELYQQLLTVMAPAWHSLAALSKLAQDD
ncbi:FGGY-family carbohydrate kinase [Streptococcus catagoni]|uniref:FGGY-family carbohydrate kinase n=1 Tax=Streptococcus catagoni TaxID=2654874 RepID=UPI00140BFAFF|nr:FGGY-family carbohydrate kinase [Streptococcus catagoni]